MTPTSYIELSTSALKANIDFITEMLGSTEFSAVVKGNAYGHGLANHCQMLYGMGVRHFSVYSASEAKALLASLQSDITVMIMGYMDFHQLEWAIENGVEFFLFEESRLNDAIDVSKKLGRPAKVHIEIETGMNRTGFEIKRLKSIFKLLEKEQAHISVQGVCSHLAGAESVANHKRVKKQYERFKKVKTQLQKLDWLNPKFHLACSAASLQYPKTKMDLARIGILQYGFFPTDEVLVQYFVKNKTQINPLKRVISWKTKVMDIKEVKTGEFVGYGNSFFTNKPTRIAILPVGYAHGLARSLSNLGKVLIGGMRLNIIGMVNMNMTIVDITEMDQIKKGDEVVIIGTQGDLEISVSSFGNYSDMVNYELLTRLPADIERKIIA